MLAAGFLSWFTWLPSYHMGRLGLSGIYIPKKYSGHQAGRGGSWTLPPLLGGNHSTGCLCMKMTSGSSVESSCVSHTRLISPAHESYDIALLSISQNLSFRLFFFFEAMSCYITQLALNSGSPALSFWNAGISEVQYHT